MNIIRPTRIPNANIIVLCYSDEALNATLHVLELRGYRWFTGRRATEKPAKLLLPVGIRLIPNDREINYAAVDIYIKEWPGTPQYRIVL